jgi:3-deoxy-manno-octulosonate cytidylyltransferase (CMP-KDO synthetase)
VKSDDVLIVIPARWKSTRLPGKPLKKIAGKTMLRRVYDRCQETALEVMVATDDDRIAKHCEEENMDYIMTSEGCLTGTDRVAELSDRLNYAGYINVQSDEPFVLPEDILAIEKEMWMGDHREVLCGMCQIDNLDHYYSPHVPKVVFDEDRGEHSGKLRYISRAPIPAVKEGYPPPKDDMWKQVCIYGFRSHHLKEFTDTHNTQSLDNPNKTRLEFIEDIELLRFVEKDIPVRMIKLKGSAMSVDTENDLEIANALWERMDEEEYCCE